MRYVENTSFIWGQMIAGFLAQKKGSRLGRLVQTCHPWENTAENNNFNVSNRLYPSASINKRLPAQENKRDFLAP